MLTNERLAELERLERGRTQGEWSWEDGPATLYAGRGEGHGLNLLGRMEPDSNGKANLDFVCAFANDARALLAELRRLTEMVNHMARNYGEWDVAVRHGRAECLRLLRTMEAGKYPPVVQCIDDVIAAVEALGPAELVPLSQAEDERDGYRSALEEIVRLREEMGVGNPVTLVNVAREALAKGV